MRSKSVVLSYLLFAGACGGSAPHASTPAPAATASAPTPHHGLAIKLTTIYVDDQDKALHFYTDVMGFAKKDDVTNGPYRWLTVTAPDDPDGSALQLAPNMNPAAKAYEDALFQQGQPATMFYTDDAQAEYERIKARGGEFTAPPKDIGFAIIAVVKDGVGNLVQISQLRR